MDPAEFTVLKVRFYRVSQDLYINTEYGIEVHGDYSRGLFFVCRVDGEGREWLWRRFRAPRPPGHRHFFTRTAAAKAALRAWHGGRSPISQEAPAYPTLISGA
jgi:hypothetical protein